MVEWMAVCLVVHLDSVWAARRALSWVDYSVLTTVVLKVSHLADRRAARKAQQKGLQWAASSVAWKVFD